MSILTDGFPDCITVDGVDYPVKTGFREWLLFDRVMTDVSVSPYDKAVKAIALCYVREVPPTAQEALSGALGFYSGEETRSTDEKESAGAKRIFDFEIDAKHIYAAFMSEYGIDLCSCNMHWWRFLTLFQGLGEDNKIYRIMEYRAVDMASVPKEKRAFYRKMKSLYRLPDMRTQEEKDADIAKSLESLF